MNLNQSMVLVGIISALVTWAIMYLDSRLFDNYKSKFAYFKGMAFVSALCASIVYIMGAPHSGPSQLGGKVGGMVGGMSSMVGGGMSNMGGGMSESVTLYDIGQDIMTGTPPF